MHGDIPSWCFVDIQATYRIDNDPPARTTIRCGFFPDLQSAVMWATLFGTYAVYKWAASDTPLVAYGESRKIRLDYEPLERGTRARHSRFEFDGEKDLNVFETTIRVRIFKRGDYGVEECDLSVHRDAMQLGLDFSRFLLDHIKEKHHA